MSFNKYLKYKTKYLNLKAQIHNSQIDFKENNQQSGGNASETFIKSLGTSPESIISPKNATNTFINSLGTSPASVVSTVVHTNKKIQNKDKDDNFEIDSESDSDLNVSSSESIGSTDSKNSLLIFSSLDN